MTGLQLGLFDALRHAAAPPAPGLRRFDDGSRRFDYTLRHASRRSIGIRVGDQGVVVSAPRWVAQRQLQSVLADKAAWVVKQLAQREQRQLAQQAARIDWRAGGTLPYLGCELTLRLGAPGAAARRVDAELLLPLPSDCSAARIRDSAQAWMQHEAQALFETRSGHFAQLLGVTVRTVKLSSAATRWGSASRDGTLRLHWRLLHFTPELVDYVIAHEVAHLREMNHGPRFWATVGELFPDWRDARHALRRSLLPPW
jgi:predicted metal-dependent hydrolase